MSGKDIKLLCTEAIWKMLDEMNPGLEKLVKETYERIREYELKEVDFELEQCTKSQKHLE